MHYNIVFRVLGYMLVFLAGAMLLCLPFSIYFGDGDYSDIILSAVLTAASGAVMIILFNKKENVRPKEGFAIVTFGWIIMSAFGALPFILTGTIPGLADAFFETMSGFTTTGATIMTDIESAPHGILFWRSLTHWIGGMGIIVLSLAILPFLGVGGMQLFKAEAPGPMADKLKPRIAETAKILWGVYLILTAVETVLLLFGGMDLFDSLCHTFGTMATGGFSTKNASVGHFDSAYIDYVISLFMLLAGTSFAMHYGMIFKGDFKSYLKSAELKFYLALIGFAIVFIGFDVYMNIRGDIGDTSQYVVFQVLSIITTTGYGTADYEQWAVSSQTILLLLMFVGGCAGSTGGGMKTIRVYLLFKYVYSEFIRLLHPQAVAPVKLGDDSIDRRVIVNIGGFFIIYMLITAAGTLIMSFFGMDFETSIGATIASLNNIGPGIGMVGPTENYAFMPDYAKWFLSLLMLMGRLEVFTVMVILIPSYWRK